MLKKLCLLSLSCLALFGQEKTFYISPQGDDAADGLSAARPFRSLDRALQASRANPAGIRIVLADGRYELSSPVRIGVESSGTKDKPLIITAVDGAHPVLSGGRVIRGFIRDEDNPSLWHVRIPAVQRGEWYFRQLFVNGERKTRARTPNTGFFRIQGPSPQDQPVKLHFRPGDIQKSWAESGDVEVIALLAWADIRMQIRAVDDVNHVATLSGDPRPSNKENDAQYWVENAPEFLDSPGEWYLERKSGILSYWAKPGEDLERAEVIAPVLRDLVDIKGAPDKPVNAIHFSGITFAHTDWTLGPNGYADTQAAVGAHGDVRAEYAEDLVFRDCTFTHLAGYGLELGPGCKRSVVVGNEFVDLGAGGIRVGVTSRPKSAAEENNSHLITDNRLHALGRIYAPAVGIFILQSGTNRVAHNEIYDLYYTPISVGWNWGYQETPCRENLIEFNHLHDAGQSWLSDMGGIYTLGIQHGTILRNNLIHDINAFTYGGWGLYTDEGSTGILLESNVVYHCKSAGFHQHYGKENVVRNNIFAFNREHQLMRTRPEPHTSFILTNNIVYFDSGDLLGSNWSNDHYVMDHNIYYDTRAGAHPDRMSFAGASFAEWQERGHDLHSRIEDPLFVAPEKFDFRLSPQSPALREGFHQIDLSTVGPRPKERRE